MAACVLVVVQGCGSGEAQQGQGDVEAAGGRHQPVGTTTEASPFRVTQEPPGYWLAQAGRGTESQAWGDDTSGNDSPLTVLAPAGEGADSPDAVVVSTTGFEGYQGGLRQASRGYGDDTEEFLVDARPAIFTPAGEQDGEPRPAHLVMEVGDDVAVQVSSAAGTRDEMVQIAQAVAVPDDHLVAPEIPDPPGDLQVVGSADADVGRSLVASPIPASEHRAAGERGYTAVWARGDRPGTWSPEDGVIVVTTLPGQALDLDVALTSLRDAFPGPVEPTAERNEVAGRPAVLLERPADGDDGWGGLRAVITSTPSGDLLLVVGHGRELPDRSVLDAVAASVEPAPQADWDELVLRAEGGEGLHPDAGAVELQRGTVGDVEWLFQARVDDGGLYGTWSSGDVDTTGQFLADPCLKLSTGDRVCGQSEIGTAGSSLVITIYDPGYSGDDQPLAHGFVLLMTTNPVTTVRLHTADRGALDAGAHEVPGGARRTALLVTDANLDLMSPECVEPGEPTAPETFELLDAAGNRLACPVWGG